MGTGDAQPASPIPRQTPGTVRERRAAKSLLLTGGSPHGSPPAPAASDSRTTEPSPEDCRGGVRESVRSAKGSPGWSLFCLHSPSYEVAASRRCSTPLGFRRTGKQPRVEIRDAPAEPPVSQSFPLRMITRSTTPSPPKKYHRQHREQSEHDRLLPEIKTNILQSSRSYPVSISNVEGVFVALGSGRLSRGRLARGVACEH
jgi:hypothetical protein